ncbi:paraquat-inducible protein A [Candidatus Sororendozoicomonas aggregata]|uniref:paraquat-inducible protein A n=1 Tax=Candidatus Sororendozoicomonas aggregata TaxID=3073239 RepID=UPI002ED5F6ED
MASDLSISPKGIWLCPDCDLAIEAIPLSGRKKACCPRCHRILARSKPDNLNTALALLICGLILYIPANFFPVLIMEMAGNQQHTSLWTGVTALWHSGMQPVAGLVFLFSMLFPLTRLLLLLLVFWSAFTGYNKPLARRFMRVYTHLREWSMLDIYVLGILVSAIKLGGMATVSMGVGLFCLAGLMVASITVHLNLNQATVWERIRIEHR